MPTMILYPTDKGIVIHNPLKGANIGRWCEPPKLPDRCDCLDPLTLQHKAAQGYVTTGEHRQGVCCICWAEWYSDLEPIWYTEKGE